MDYSLAIVSLIVGGLIGYAIGWRRKHLINHKHFIIHKLNIIMGKIDDLNTLVAELQTSVDTKQDQIAAAIAAFEQTIADLTAQIGTGTVTDEQLQTVIDNLTSAKEDLEATPTS